jgi:RND family efflux transporter MFP subunit
MTKRKLLAIGVISLALGAGITAMFLRNNGRHAHAQEPASAVKEAVQVKVVHPRKDALQRLCIQPGSVNSFESIQLYAKVPGFLKFQKVDIGDSVKKGDLLAIVDVPDIEAQVERNVAAVEKTESQLLQMKAHVDVAYANLDAAQAAVTQADATAKSAAAWVKYRILQLGRMDSLVKSSAIEDRLYDESKERHDASIETENSAKAAIVTTKANVVACRAKIEQAKADVIEAEAEIKVAKAELKKSKVNLDFATITAPFNGVITYRSMNPGDFVRGANGGAVVNPLLTVQRTDLFRVVVLVPDRDVEFISKGKSAEMEIDSLPGRKFSATVSRIATSLDQSTRLMRVELDLPNPTGKIYHGMYGQVTIVLEKGENQLSIPTSCVAGKIEDGKASVYVVRGGRAEKVLVEVGMDTGLRVAVLKGLAKDDQVILNPSSEISEHSEVNPSQWNEATSP